MVIWICTQRISFVGFQMKQAQEQAMIMIPFMKTILLPTIIPHLVILAVTILRLLINYYMPFRHVSLSTVKEEFGYRLGQCPGSMDTDL